ncbi:MAG: hypothetical protein H6907_11435 [Hyphomicrobiales bacterium]|nr:hypothetical protein [Hyphomicrobiales bacterium]MCP5372334.1 hypothetical protein [Hyphomicrobiales bacterium]
MAKKKFVPTPVSRAESTPFDSAEEAWFWYVRCQVARNDGARFVANSGLFVRPCEPDDIFCAVMQLIRSRKISRQHLRVLMAYGLREAPPDPRCGEEAAHAALWDLALDRLTTRLRAKGIVAPPAADAP